MTPDLRDAYARAEQLLPGNAERLIVGGEATPRFLPGEDRFWFRERTRAGERLVLVDPERAELHGALDGERFTAALLGASGEQPPPGRLPCSAIELDGTGSATLVSAQSLWRYRDDDGSCTRLDGPDPDGAWSIAPGGRWAARVVGHDLWLIDCRDGARTRVTTDGTAERPYGEQVPFRAMEHRLRGVAAAPQVVWSPDGRSLVVERVDASGVEPTHLLETLAGEPRPRLHSYPYALPGDPAVVRSELFVVAAEDAAVTPVALAPVPLGLYTLCEHRRVWWSAGSDRIELVTQERDARDARLIAVDPSSGAARVVVEERRDTVLDPGPSLTERPVAHVLDGGRGAVWYSERDGWAHLWHVEGDAWRQLTSGPWVVRELLHVDEAAGEVLFAASGREPDGGPYDRRLYRVGLDGGEPRLLTPEPLDHQLAASPSGRFVVDCQSSVETPPRSVLRGADGAVALQLAEADVSALRATGWRAPRRFTVQAADGETELHGLLYLPAGFDEGRRWPLLDMIYPGPQMAIAERRFGLGQYQCEAFAELGVAVMVLDARGTPLRSKAFHDAAYGCLESTEGLRDHVGAIAQLAERHPWIDVDRVGIVGHSGGGYAAVRALVEHPDVYALGISTVGNHDNRRYHAGWGERYIGLVEEAPEAWERQSNVPLARRLRGRLLLGLAELDANVHPSATHALVAALVAADRDHDVVLVPGGDHWCAGDTPYFVRRMWDYVVTHLLGERPPAYRIAQTSLAPRPDVGV